MNKEQIETAAKEYCIEKGIEPTIYNIHSRANFLQSMIDKGVVVDKDSEIEAFNNGRLSGIADQKRFQSTVSSANEEVKPLHFFVDKLRVDLKPKNCFGVVYNIIEITEKAAELYANQFKETPAKVISDDEIETMVKMNLPLRHTARERHYLSFGAKWYREQLIKK
jgi:hypothetical protein